MTEQYEIPAIGTILIGRSQQEIIDAGGNTTVAKEGQEYEVVSHSKVFGMTDLVIDGAVGTYSVEPDNDGHNYLTFFKHKE